MAETSHVGGRVARRSYRRRAARAVVLLLACAALGCGSGGERQREPLTPGPAGAGDLNGVRLRGELVTLESFPVQLVAHVTITNSSGVPKRLDFPDGCVVLLRAYRDDRRVWDQAGSTACTMAIETVALDPGQSRTFRSPTVSAAEILGRSLAAGQYRMAAYLRPSRSVVEVELGTADLAT
jgi:hypothetical protein